MLRRGRDGALILLRRKIMVWRGLAMARRNSGIGASVFTLPFVMCLLVLTAAAFGRMAVVRWLNVVTRKEPIPLRKSLSALDKLRLGDYKFLKAHLLSEAIENSLGTDEYIDWVLEDSSVTRRVDPRRYVHLFVTYYTGGPNLAPHTPDVCYLGSGYQPKQAHENRKVAVPALGEGAEVPVRVCTFCKTAIFNQDEPTVVYTFNANGRFTSTRNGVRNLTHGLRDKYAYFSKVEVSFGGPGCRPPNLGREESVAAASKILNVVLPLLVQEHWPDWKAPDEPGDAEGE